MRVAIVMPPTAETADEATLDGWPSVVQQATALSELTEMEVMVACRTSATSCAIARHGVPYLFASSDGELVDHVRAWQPDVVHVHGLGFTRLTIRLGKALHHTASIVLQHHGEPPGSWRTVLGHRVARRFVDGYLFTGALYGQAQPFIDRHMIRKRAACFEVLEAASTLPDDGASNAPPISLVGSPAVLWVGRLIDSKDPLTAIAAFALAAADALSTAHLHLLATDRSLEGEVRAAVAALGPLGERVHVHAPAAASAMRGWYRAADIMLSTSWREGSGYSLIEAITEGCVPVATTIPSHRSIVGNLAPMFAPGDVTAAAALLVAASTFDVAAVRAFAAENLSWLRVTTQLSYAYESTRRPRL